jgi:hypothetical protein
MDPLNVPRRAWCLSAMPAMLQRNSDIDYPVISAACRSNRPQLVQLDRQRRGG